MNLSSYFSDLLLVCALCACAGAFFTAGEDRPVAKSISAALGVILLFAAVRPLADLPALRELTVLSADPDPLSQESSAESAEAFSALMEKAYGEGIGRAVAGRFSLKEEEIEVRTSGFSYPEMTAERIRVLLTGGARTADLRGIRQYVEEHYGECEVEIGYA